MEDQNQKPINIDLDVVSQVATGIPASCLPEEKAPPTEQELEKIESVNALLRGDFKGDQFLPEKVVEAATLAAEKFSTMPKCAMAASMLMMSMFRYAGIKATADAKVRCFELQKDIEEIRKSKAKVGVSMKKKITVKQQITHKNLSPNVNQFSVNVNALPQDKK
jgi:hypothetical protein